MIIPEADLPSVKESRFRIAGSGFLLLLYKNHVFPCILFFISVYRPSIGAIIAEDYSHIFRVKEDDGFDHNKGSCRFIQ